MQTHTQVSATPVEFILNTLCKHTKALSVFVVFFLLCSNWVSAQRTININNENSGLRSSQVLAPIVNDYLGKSEQAREFDFNPQLKSLTKENEGDILLLDFFEGKQYRAVIKRVIRDYNGVIGITAKVENTDFGYCYISVSEDGILINTELPGKNEYYMATSQTGRGRLSEYTVTEVRKKELPCLSLTPPRSAVPEVSGSAPLRDGPLQAPLADCSNTVTGDNIPTTIRVLVVYTSAAEQYARVNLGSNIKSHIDQAMLKANEASGNSKLGITFELAFSYQTDYQEVNSSDDLDALTDPNDGKMDEVHTYRMQYNADLVMFVPYVNFTGGVGWLFDNQNGNPALGFALTTILNSQLSTTYSMVHEMGHNMGCGHAAGQSTQPGPGFFPYSSGWNGSIGGQNKCTIMTYEGAQYWGGSISYTRIPYFSSPDMTVSGVVIGNAATMDNARTFRQTKHITAFYKELINNTILNDLKVDGTTITGFSSDVLNYFVNTESATVTIAGTTTSSCATVLGNVTNTPLSYGENIFRISARSNDGTFINSYKVTINRVVPACTSYQSRPSFSGDISAPVGDNKLNLKMAASIPAEIKKELVISSSSQKVGRIIIRQNSSSNICDDHNANFYVWDAIIKIKVTKTGDYIFSNLTSCFLSVFDSNDISCSHFLGSNAYWTENDSFNRSSIYTISLTANKDYYIRTLHWSAPQTWNISISSTVGDVIVESDIPPGTSYTYIAVDQSGMIKMQNATADFRTLSAGTYTIYGAPYSTMGATNPANFIGKTLAEIYSSDCVIPSSTSITMTVEGTVLVDAATPVITGQPQQESTYTQNDTATPLTVTATISDAGAGGSLSYQWYSNATSSSTGGTSLDSDNGAQTSSYTPSTATEGTTYYYVIVTNTNSSVNGTQTVSTTSAVAGVIVKAIPTYGVSIGSFIGGSISASSPNSGNASAVFEGEIVTLVITTETGNMLDAIAVYKTSEQNVSVNLSGSGNENGATRTFTMPAYGVTVAATFGNSTDQQTVLDAKQVIETASYTLTQAVAFDETSLKTALAAELNTLLTANSISYTVDVANITIQNPIYAITGTVGNLPGDNGSFSFTVSLQKGNSTTITTTSKNGIITATAYDASQDNADIIAAKSAVEGAGYTDTQINIPTSTAAKAKVEAIISGLSLSGVIPTVVEGVFTAAIAGTPSNQSGTNGSYTFTVNLNKGGGTQQTTILLTFTITATAYDASQDNADITAAKGAIEGAGYTDTQVNVPTEAAAKAKVEAIISGLSLSGVIPTVVEVAFTAAISGTPSNPSGTNGSYTFTVNLNKGGGTQQTTIELTLTIIATAYDASQDNADITAAKSLIEGANYEATQANVTTIVQAKSAVESILSTLSLNGVTATVVDGAFTAATAGTLGTPSGMNGSYTFTVNLNKGGGAQQITKELTLTITATPYIPPLTYQVNIGTITNGTVTANPTTATESSSITLTITPAEGYELDAISANKTGDENTIVTLSGSDATRTFTMPAYDVTVNATFKKTTDQLAVEAARTAINNMNDPVTVVQATANTEDAVKTWLAGQINALSGVSAANITVTASNISISGFAAANTGTVGNLPGDNGSFSFTVSLQKGNSTTITTTSKNGIITATAYDASQDNADIIAAKSAVEGAGYTDTQINIPTSTAAKAKVEAIISGLSLSGVIPTVVEVAFTTAISGTPSNPSGTNGSYTFTVNLNKGGGTQQTTIELTLTIIATAYDASQDNADITAAKQVVESATYEATQTNVTTIVQAKTAVESILSTLSLNGVTATVVDGTFTAAVAGSPGNEPGTNGSYTFTVNLNKGGGAQQTTIELTLAIIATPYIPPLTYQVNIGTTTNGTVTANPTTATESSSITLTITPAEGYELDAISANKTGDENTIVTLSGSDATRTFTMPGYNVMVNASFKKTADQLAVEAARTAINNMNDPVTVAQATANTEDAVKTWLAGQINALSGVSAVSITVTASNISISGFAAANTGTVGNLPGDNGSFLFMVSLQKGNSTTITTTSKNGIITATAYDASQDNADITAAKSAIEGAGYTDTQINIPTEVAAKAKVESLISALLSTLSLNAVTFTVMNGTFTAAISGTSSNPSGTDGSYTFTVNLNKGGGTQQTTIELTLTIIATAYDASQDNADITAAKQVVESATYEATQTNVTTIVQAKTAVESILSTLSLNGVTATVVDGTFTAAVAGSLGNEPGTNGSYIFTVNLNKGGGAQQTTIELTLAIVATPYTSPTTYLVNIGITAYGTVTANPTTATESSAITLTITPAEGYELDAISANKTGDKNTIVTLSGSGTTRTFVMPAYNVTVNASFKKTVDQLAVEAAQTAINSMNDPVTVAQVTANTEDAVKTWLAGQINALSGVSAANITIAASDISISGFAAAVAGTANNQTGGNGSFLFTVSLKKANSATITTTSKNGIITATPYDATQDNADISSAKMTIEGASYTGTQENVSTQVAAKAKVGMTIGSLNLNGVTTTVVGGVYIDAIAGTPSNPSGTNGSYTFTVNLNKGGGTQQTTMLLTLMIIATAYDVDQDNDDISAAKGAIEGASYTDTQVNVPTQTAAKAKVETIIGGLNLNGVTTTVVDGVFTPAIAGMSGSPLGTNGSYTFTVNLSKGGGAQQTTIELTLTIIATPYTPPPAYLVNIGLIAYGTVTANPATATESSAITLTITPAEGYELDAISANKTGDENTIVTLSGSDATRTFTMPAYNVTVNATFKKTADQLAVEAARTAINNMNDPVTVAQSTANTEDAVKTWLAEQINALSGVSAVSITVTASDISISGFAAAVAGTANNQTGGNGSFLFTVSLKKANSATITTTSKNGIITATPYDATQDNADISSAKMTIEGASYTDTQENVPTQEAAKAKVGITIGGLNLNGVTTTVVGGVFTDAVAGTPSNPSGTNGSYTFTVNLNKGGGTQQTTILLTLTITATPYDASQDNADITAAKQLVEGTTYEATQANVTTIAQAKTAVGSILSTLSLNGVTPTVVDGIFTPAIAGIPGSPLGTNGSYTFTVNLNKGGGAQQTTGLLTLTIIATPYTLPPTYQVSIGLTTNGTVTANPTTATESSSIILTITATEGYELDAISANKTGDKNTTVALSGSGTTRTFVMPAYNVTVNTSFKKTADQLAVEAAQAAINGMGNQTVAQATANTANAVKTWLVGQINTLSGMSGTGITVVASNISISGFTAAVAGTANNQAGRNGSFSFIVSLKKANSATVATASKSGVITATGYIAPSYTVTIAPASNGTVTANPVTATANTTVTLNISPLAGYELDAISVSKADDSNITVTLSGSGATRTFVMPAYNVTVTATFKKTADQLIVETAQSAIEGMSNTTVEQAMANTEASVKAWLAQQINALSGVSATGLVVIASDISVSGFSAAVEGTSGNPLGTNGSFSFTVSLKKGSSTTITTANKNGVITATAYIAPLYAITIGTISNGTVSANLTSAEAGKTVTLSISPAQGYELESISTTPSLTLAGSGNTRTFTMPASDVAVNAIFKKTQEQLDKEAVEAAKIAIEGGTFHIAQATGNTESSVKTWLINILNVMFGNSHNIQFRSIASILGDVTLTALTPAVTGTENTPEGTSGSFKFTVVVTCGATTLTTVATSGVIIAIPYASTPVKRTELLLLRELMVHIINTGNIATGDLTLALSGINADAFTLPSSTISSLAVGNEMDILLSPRNNLPVGTYKATLTVSGEGMTPVSIEITYTVTIVDIDNPQGEILKAWIQNGLLYVSGLTEGKPWNVYNASGTLIHHSMAENSKVSINLYARGVYVVTSDKGTVKVVY